MKLRFLLAIIVCGALFTSGCGKSDSSDESGNSSTVSPLVSKIEMTDLDGNGQSDEGFTITTAGGDIVIEFVSGFAENSKTQITTLIDQGFYDNMWFSRAVPNFVIQIGDPGCRLSTASPVGACDLSGGSGTSVAAEPVVSGQNSFQRGSVSMAQFTDTDQTKKFDSQFFICLSQCSNLNSTFAIFGNVKSGMGIADAIFNSIKSNPLSINAGTADNPDYRLFQQP